MKQLQMHYRLRKKILINIGFIILVIILLNLLLNLSTSRRDVYSVEEILQDINQSNRQKKSNGSCYNQLPLWTSEVHANRPQKRDFTCSEEKNWLTINNGLVHFPSTKTMLECTAQDVIREGDNDFSLGPSFQLKHKDSVPADGFQTQCQDKKSGQQQKILYGGVRRANSIDKSTVYKGPHHNIIMLMIDSVSRLEFQRSLPKSVALFKSDKIGGHVLESYNIVGDGTPAAVQPILTGMNEEELPEARKGHAGAQHVDIHPWIFKRLHKLGYATQWMEEQTDYGTFQMRMMGFKEPPVHHYLRPYMIAQNKLKNGYCVGSEKQADREMGLLKELFRVYPDKPKFSYIHFADLSHENLDINFLDNSFVSFMEWMIENGHMDNTLFLLCADHGARFSSLRSTLQGRMEERLPMMGIALPHQLKKQFPILEENLKTNVHRLTTPYDIHATFQHMLNLTSGVTKGEDEDRVEQVGRGASILLPIRKTRNCANAQIPPHWCACSYLTPLKRLDHRLIKDAAAAFLEFANQRTEPQRSKCHILSIEKVLRVQMGSLPENMLKFSESKDDRGLSLATLDSEMQGGLLMLTLLTSPNKGRYEVTVLWYRQSPSHKPLFRTGGEYVSRTDKYGTQSSCILPKFPYLREYCYCEY